MAKRRILPKRSFAEIFRQGREVGNENVLLNDAEYGVILAGGDKEAYAPGSVANMRSIGRLRSPVVKVGRQPRTRLSDALRELERMTRRAAA